MKKSNNTNQTNVIPNLFRNLENIKILNQVQDDNTVIVQNNIKDKNRNELINLSTHRLIDLAAFTLAEGATHVDLPPTKVKLAFTLAEVLITLGIIGIVAAMTIPTLMQKYYEKQTVTKLKETYSIISQALKLCGEENGYPEEWGITGRNKESTAIVAEKIMPFLKISLDCGMNMEKSDKCFPETYKRLNNSKEYETKSSFRNHVLLLNGTSLGIESAEVEAGIYLYFLVDTNSASPPNTWGKDIFEFSYRQDIGLVPSGHPEITNNSYKTTCYDTGDVGFGCAYYVLNFGDMAYLHRKP